MSLYDLKTKIPRLAKLQNISKEIKKGEDR